jgi:uncharacterized membrane protein
MNYQEPDKETLQRWHRDPNNWKWGIFYFNPHDKRIVVLKRNEAMGITFNYAHTISHIITIAILVVIGAMIVLASKVSH